MPSYPDPFQTPSRKKPARVYHDPNDLVMDPPAFGHYRNQSVDDKELSFVDEQMDLHDVQYSDDEYERSAMKSPEQTKQFTPRISQTRFRQEAHNATVLELTKLVSHLKGNQRSVYSVILSSKLTLVFIVLVALLLASNYRPFCTSGRYFGLIYYNNMKENNWFPCQRCPTHALVCNPFRILKCSENYTVHEGRLCVRNDSSGILAYDMSIIAKEYLEQLAYQVDCLGKPRSKKVNETALEDFLLSENIRTDLDATPTHGFKLMKELFSDNEDYYQVAEEPEEDSLYSYRFLSTGSCIFTKHHFRTSSKTRSAQPLISDTNVTQEPETVFETKEINIDQQDAETKPTEIRITETTTTTVTEITSEPVQETPEQPRQEEIRITEPPKSEEYF